MKKIHLGRLNLQKVSLLSSEEKKMLFGGGRAPAACNRENPSCPTGYACDCDQGHCVDVRDESTRVPDNCW